MGRGYWNAKSTRGKRQNESPIFTAAPGITPQNETAEMAQPYTFPLLFTSDMVRALLDGRKTQHRVLPTPKLMDVRKAHLADRPVYAWVREDWWSGTPTADYPHAVSYRAHDDARYRPLPDGEAWRYGILMPRWASRITLEITAARIERLQGMTEKDAIAEGAHLFPPSVRNSHKHFSPNRCRECAHVVPVSVDMGHPDGCPFAERWDSKVIFFRDQGCSPAWGFDLRSDNAQEPSRLRFRWLWDNMYPLAPWWDNPEVVALTFKVHRQNIDAIRPEK